MSLLSNQTRVLKGAPKQTSICLLLIFLFACSGCTTRLLSSGKYRCGTPVLTSAHLSHDSILLNGNANCGSQRGVTVAMEVPLHLKDELIAHPQSAAASRYDCTSFFAPLHEKGLVPDRNATLLAIEKRDRPRDFSRDTVVVNVNKRIGIEFYSSPWGRYLNRLCVVPRPQEHRHWYSYPMIAMGLPFALTIDAIGGVVMLVVLPFSEMKIGL